MATTIATISMVLLMVLLQHLYNWGVRLFWKMFDEEEETTSIILTAFITLLNVILTTKIIQTIIHLNK